MYVIAMISRKGGAGKTNLAVHLAACAEGKGVATGIVDLDPQGTATKWGMRRSDNELRSGAEVVSAQPTSVPRLLDAARAAGAKLMILDTAPHADSIAVDAARVSDFVLIPCRPAIADLEAIPASADIARLAKTPFAVVLNSVGAQGARENEARQELQRLGLELAPTSLGHRVAYADAMIPGEGVTEHRNGTQASAEIEELFNWLWAMVERSTRHAIA
ncbi:AAA family ATPase [Acidiphilium acidophilum]|uniref:AAA family ATPase n=1 Tax=Acidiphilium acidophilum TaxID=76588 RepID=UPI002E8E715E|nr:AAA family ATPase [Acidiphilium acidophilum]